MTSGNIRPRKMMLTMVNVCSHKPKQHQNVISVITNRMSRFTPRDHPWLTCHLAESNETQRDTETENERETMKMGEIIRANSHINRESNPWWDEPRDVYVTATIAH